MTPEILPEFTVSDNTAQEYFTSPSADPTLETLATEINAAHREAKAHASKAVERALRAGDLLNAVKSQMKHGEFIPWCRTHCPDLSQRTIQNYMKVARKLPAEKRIDAHFGLNEALRLLAAPAEKEPVAGPYAHVMPPMSAEEYAEFKDDIAARGVMVPVEYDEAGNILDGHHRVKACRELGIEKWPSVVRIGMDEAGKIHHILMLNLCRSHDRREERP